jgi:methanogenic corrinoid protein MtbC1
LEPAARSYGRGWVNDDCDFTEVTVGCWRLQQIMHDYSADFHREVTLAGHHSARIWLSAVPGEQHTFGVSMLREFFVRAGHEVIGMPSASGNVISETVKREYLDVLGLSVAGDVTGKVLKGLIDGVRMYSRNRAIRILIGGAALMENPELCTQVGADGWAKGAREALKMVNNWCAALVVQDGA